MRKTCVGETRAAGASSSEVGLHCGWTNGTQDRSYARASLQTTMDVITKGAGFAKDFREHHHLGRAEVPVPRAWHNALLPGLTSVMDTISSLPCGVAETLQCIELFVQAFWQALTIRMLKYGPDFQPPTGPPSLWFKRLPLKRRSAVQFPVFRNLVYELTAGQVGTGFAWKLCICCAAATPVSGTGLLRACTRERRRKGVKVFLKVFSRFPVEATRSSTGCHGHRCLCSICNRGWTSRA